MKAQHALIVGAAPARTALAFYHALIVSAEYVIAADGGTALCLEAGRVPDLCIGDFDSAAPEIIAEAEHRGAAIERHPADKDESDLDLALRAARERGARSVSFTAAFSGRFDHTVAALGTLLRAAELRGRALEPTFTAYAIAAAGEVRLSEPPGTTCSLFAIDPDTRVTVRGTRYELEDAVLPALVSLGLSNVAVRPEQTIRVASGRVLVIVSASDGEYLL